MLVNEGIKNDIYCNGFLYNNYSDDEKLKVAKQIIGEEIYFKLFKAEKTNVDLPYTDKEQEFLKLTSIIQDSEDGIKFLKLLDKNLINEIGFDEWKKIVKYSFNNKNLEYLYNVINLSKTETLLKFVKNISPLIKDDKALGVNKFLTITRFYDKNTEFCNSLLEKFENEDKLTDIEQINLETLIYRNNQNKLIVTPSTLKDLIVIEQQQLINNNSYNNKDQIFTFLFNMSESDVNDFLRIDINSKTIAQIKSRAKDNQNKKLLLEADFMGIVVDIIENIKYNYSEENLNKIVKNLSTAPQEQIIKIRKIFGNIPEMTRHFYEIEAQEELINLEKLKNNKEICKEYDGIKVIDLSRIKHTFYAHVFEGSDIHSFFDTDYGKVTICVSTETDKHEAYYYDNDSDDNIVMVFTKVQNGGFIGSSPENMSSNSKIKFNDFEVDNKSLYNQKSIRELYNKDGYAETLLYRGGLIPTGLKISKVPPSEFQLQTLKKLQNEVRKIKGHENDKLVFVTTQGSRNRTINYKENSSKQEYDTNLSVTEENIQELRKNFFGLLNSEFSNNTYMRESIYDGNYYTIINDDIFSEVQLTKREKKLLEIAVKLEKIIHKNDPETVIKYEEIENRVVMNELQDSRNLWHLSRKNGSFSKKTNESLLKEFLVDHLMCNYAVGNADFALNSSNIIRATNKKEAFSEIDDFVSNDGLPYTEMSYYYYVHHSNKDFYSDANNNVYRKVFESYINSPNSSEILDEKSFEEMKMSAKTISDIPTDMYMQMFKDILESISDSEERGKMEHLIRARKENIVKDTYEFIERIKNERKIAQNIEKIKSTNTVALINDIHGNASALEELLKRCEEDGKTDVFILGDMIGFGAESNKCLDIIRAKSSKLNIRCILGNHELYSLMGNSSFAKLDLRELDLTTKIRKEMSKENRMFLESLPITRKVNIGGKIVEFTHFPIKKDFFNDSEIYLAHGMSLENTSSGNEADYVIYGHEHRTEYTTGDEVGNMHTQIINGTTFINLPSSGCVHGKNTTYTVLNSNENGLSASVIPINYDKEKNDKAIRSTKNPYPHFFGTNFYEGENR